MTRRTITIALTIAALCLSMVATASAATPHHRGVSAHHVTKTHRHGRRHAHVKVRRHANVTRAVVHNDPIAVTALGVHHTGDPVAFAATAR